MLRTLLAAGTLPLLLAPARGQCPEGSGAFGPPGPDGAVNAQVAVDLGAGPRLVVGGSFGAVPGAPARNVALFDGATWSQLGDGLEETVLALAVFDDGSGPAIWAGGYGYVARLAGASWHVTEVSGDVLALEVHDDGGGPALYAGGDFFAIDGALMQPPARYDGAWSAVLPNQAGGRRIEALASHDDGAGAALYLGGSFESLAGTPARRIARWDGAGVSEVGGGIDALPGLGVSALLSVVGPGGVPELHVGGAFDAANGAPSSRWLAWRAGAWLDFGGDERVADLATCRVGGAELVHAARASGVERLQGGVRTLLPYDDPVAQPRSVGALGAGATQELLLGLFDTAEDGAGLQRWNGAGFLPPASGLGLQNAAAGLAVHAFGALDELVAVGTQPLLFGAKALRYDGAAWHALPDLAGVNPYARAAISHAGQLYAAGSDAPLGPARVWRLAASAWEPVGSSGSGSFATARALARFDDGAGAKLYVGGRFDQLGAAGTRGLARLDGASWQSVGGGIGSSGFEDAVESLVAWHDDGGPALYAGGRFTAMGTVAANGVARWDGGAWSALGAGVTRNGLGGGVSAMTVFDDGAREWLVVGGLFDMAGGIATASLAAWDGSAWQSFGRGLERETAQGLAPGSCTLLQSFDLDGSGERLYVLGDFDLVDGVAAEGAAVWDGAAWSPIDFDGRFWLPDQRAALVHDDGAGRALFLSGELSSIGGVASARIARLSDPCGAIVGLPRCTSSPSSTGAVALMRASGSASVSADALTLSARALPAGVSTLFVMAPLEARVPFGAGLRCVGGALRRLPALNSGPAGLAELDFDFGAPYASGVAPGSRRFFQAFFRDTVGGVTGFNTSDALELLFRP